MRLKIIIGNIFFKYAPKKIVQRYILIRNTRHYGKKNPDKVFVIIRYSNDGLGILALWRNVIAQIKWAIGNNFIPIVDYRNKSYIGEEFIFNKNNMWEWFFGQAQDYNLNDALESKNVILNAGKYDNILKLKNSYEKGFYKKNLRFLRKYVWFKPEIELKFKKKVLDVLPEKEKVLGISVRENFYLNGEFNWSRAKLHPKEPNIMDVIRKAKHLMKLWECKYCFISTIYEDTIELFKNEFGNNVLFMNRKRGKLSEARVIMEEKIKSESIGEKSGYKKSLFQEKDTYTVMYEYLAEQYILSKCTYLLATKSSGSISAVYWNGGEFEDIYFFEDENYAESY